MYKITPYEYFKTPNRLTFLGVLFLRHRSQLRFHKYRRVDDRLINVADLNHPGSEKKNEKSK